MSYNIGDKFIIEIGEEYVPYRLSVGENRYRIKGFNTLFFDENGLNRLERYEEPKSERGWKEVNDTFFGGTRAQCLHCGETFWHYMKQFDFCPKCGHYNGEKP